MARLRIQRTNWPHLGFILTDTPRPNCWACGGDGGHAYDRGDPETGEYADTDWEPCPCWDDRRAWTLLRLPRKILRFRRSRPGESDEPPF